SGSRIFDVAVADTRQAGGLVLPGDKAVQLHDTYGFPIDLNLEMPAAQGLAVDEDGFRGLMAQQRERAKADAAKRRTGHGDRTVYRDLLAMGATDFVGYEQLTSATVVRGIITDGQRGV